MRGYLTLMLLVLALCGSALQAQESTLRSLQTANDGKGWEAVGRLNIGTRGFCTGALVAPDLVLTAAHCLYDKSTGRQVSLEDLEFLAGWRNGRAEAYRRVRRVVEHPRYSFATADRVDRVAYDLALVELERPIRLTGVTPFDTARRPRKGDEVGVVSYAEDRAEAPSLQEVCHVLAGRAGVLMLSCSVNFGSSGAPVFTFEDGVPRIVSVVSSKAEVGDRPVALVASLAGSLDLMRSRLAAGEGQTADSLPLARRFSQDGVRSAGGAKFVRP
ncbi:MULTISPECIES: trypsin-like serine peptidase [Actibacterium]|uniref:Serine protease n=1 Tax=Actibacterium naphthalenivorans TaxID=1614693 RepID=A0A840CEN8_9RHOB|nr:MULTISPECIES: trypsin-like serine protease [Actibacterium]MBB4022562.1 V8-like Glu-specific endopeptidase [Actibacterium naphthalenivorans]